MEFKVIEIPIKDYEKDMECESAKGKKNEILDLFATQNKLRSLEELHEIKYKLHGACQNGEIELIKIYLSETIEDDIKSMLFKINKTDKTASLFKVTKETDQIIIPRSVKYESDEYLITSITGIGNNVKTVNFDKDSLISTIYREAFYNSNVEEIIFPPSLYELRNGWCRETRNLRKITISPSNDKFTFKDGKYLLGKTDNNSKEFDKLLFAVRDIEEISIPSNITEIYDYSFEQCNKLAKVEIPINSKLQTIGRNAFSFTKINKIFIPSTVLKLSEKIFSNCQNLSIIEFQENSNLQTIEMDAFAYSGINEISVPATVSKICKFAFYHCSDLNKIEIPMNSNLQKIGSFAFAFSSIKEIYFPENLIELKKKWCFNTDQLKKITISPLNNKFKFIDGKYLLGKIDNNSEEFDRFLFAVRDIEEISIPSNVTEICKCAFFNCINLRRIIIPTDSKLKTIEEDAFSFISIKEIFIPSNLSELKDGWCKCLGSLSNIVISPLNNKFIFVDGKYLLGKTDDNSEEFDRFLYAVRDIEKISIPSNITEICECAFDNCEYLEKVEFPVNSKLKIIGKTAFSFSCIREIFIPASIEIIDDDAFSNCQDLTKVEFKANSNLQRIGDLAFSFTNIISLLIPANLSTIGTLAFFGCMSFQILEFPEDSKMQSFSSTVFSNCSNLKIMIPQSIMIHINNDLIFMIHKNNDT